MDIKGKRILVTGADGFIGSHLVEHLLTLGCKVKPFVFYNSFNSRGWLDTIDRALMSELNVVAGDVRDYNFVRHVMRDVDIVFHLAALVAIPYSYHAPASYVETNVMGTLNIVQAANELDLERIIHTSTSEVYGSALFVPMSESHPLQAQSPYSASKIGADSIALSFYKSFNTPVIIARPFNTYGPRQSARAIIPSLITQLLNGMKQIRVGSLHPTRDFNYVKDTVSGLIAVAQADEAIGDVVNIGSSNEISIEDLIKLLCRIIDVEVELIVDNQRLRPQKSEVDRLLADNSKITTITSWNPAYSLKNGLTETITWFSNPANLGLYKHDTYNT